MNEMAFPPSALGKSRKKRKGERGKKKEKKEPSYVFHQSGRPGRKRGGGGKRGGKRKKRDPNSLLPIRREKIKKNRKRKPTTGHN